MIFSKLLLLFLPETSAAADATDQMAIKSSEHQQVSVSVLRALESDVYYCYLVPLTIPVTILTCYANWVGLKFFRHN